MGRHGTAEQALLFWLLRFKDTTDLWTVWTCLISLALALICAVKIDEYIAV